MATTIVQNTEGEPQTEVVTTSAPEVTQPAGMFKGKEDPGLNIPPEGVRFRLRARESKYVMYSRDKNNPVVSHYSGPEYNDQIFTLIYGKGEHKGLYAIKSWDCGKVLYSRVFKSPHVGNIEGDGIYPDNWFKFQQDEYDLKSFRIYCPQSDAVIYSRTSNNPTFGNYTGPKYDDQLWRFVLVDSE